MKHTWHRNACGKCGVTRHVPPGPRREFALNMRDEEDRSRTESPFRYRLPDGGAELTTRPACASKGASRTARRNGRRRRVLAASRAGGRRLESKEARARRAVLENAPAPSQGPGAPAILEPSPTVGPDETPIAS